MDSGNKTDAEESPTDRVTLMGTEGNNNTFYGKNAGYWNADNGKAQGDNNTFIGEHAGSNITNGDGNTYIGLEAGRLNNTGMSNTILGAAAGHAFTDMPAGPHRAKIIALRYKKRSNLLLPSY